MKIELKTRGTAATVPYISVYLPPTNPYNGRMKYDVIIIGAGAAGLMCAIEAGKRGRSVAVIEHNTKVGQKIRISGGGRCNFTNINATSEHLLSGNPHFAKSALARFTPTDFIALVQKHKIPFHEKKLGQQFCDKSAQDIIDMLLKECRSRRVEILCQTKVKNIIARGPKADMTRFQLDTTAGQFESQSLVIATGALSIPPLGATDFGYRIAQQFGMSIRECRPGLVPLTFQEHDQKIFASLSGVSVDAIVSFGRTSFRENILFTHRGLSGPAILQISSYWQPKEAILINLCPEKDMLAIFKSLKSKSMLNNILKDHIPSRLADILSERIFSNKPLNQYSVKELEAIAGFLQRWTIIPSGTEGYAKAEVTVGGVDTSELSSKTMESKKVPGLYFIGEVVDVTGRLGGYNFQWAWASGFAAGQAV